MEQRWALSQARKWVFEYERTSLGHVGKSLTMAKLLTLLANRYPDIEFKEGIQLCDWLLDKLEKDKPTNTTRSLSLYIKTVKRIKQKYESLESLESDMLVASVYG